MKKGKPKAKTSAAADKVREAKAHPPKAARQVHDAVKRPGRNIGIYATPADEAALEELLLRIAKDRGARVTKSTAIRALIRMAKEKIPEADLWDAIEEVASEDGRGRG